MQIIVMKSLVLIFSFTCLLSCKDDSVKSNPDYRLLQQQLNGLQWRMDSLIIAIQKKEPSKGITQSKSKKTKKNSNSSTYVSSNPSNNSATGYTWKISSENKTAPSYRPAKQKEVYQIRVGAICCDSSRSYATGRGACSHHGGVCRWLYE